MLRCTAALGIGIGLYARWWRSHLDRLTSSMTSDSVLEWPEKVLSTPIKHPSSMHKQLRWPQRTGAAHTQPRRGGPAAQIGAVLGKGGSAIAILRAETGCLIRVVPLEGPAPEGVCVPSLSQMLSAGEHTREGVEVMSIEGRHGCVIAAVKAAAQQLKRWQVWPWSA